MIDLKDKVAVVTGGAHGIGRAISVAFAAAGAAVFIADIDVEAGSETAAAIRKNGGDATFCRADASTVSAQARPTQLWPPGCKGAGPSATLRMTPSAPTTSAMSPATRTTVDATSGARSDRRALSSAAESGFMLRR